MCRGLGSAMIAGPLGFGQWHARVQGLALAQRMRGLSV